MYRHAFLAISVLMLLFPISLSAQKLQLSGNVRDKQTGDPVEFATVVLEGTGQWAVADAKGDFSIKNIDPGKHILSISCLGYVADTREITISKDITSYKAFLNQDNLSLEGATVTAKEDANSATTSRTIDKTALDHVQIMNVGDIAGLLPGGATTNPTLTSDQTMSIRSGSSEAGNASFGTAIEVDGVRLSSNASFAGASTTSTNIKGATTNNIASSNIESVEVITGVPSVEYGDMTSGVVKINTRKGKTPWMFTASTSPKTKQVSLSKGFGLGNTSRGASRGVLNFSAEYTNSVSREMSPYTAYDRKQLNLTYSNLLNNGAFAEHPLRVSVGATGNIGGLDSKADPDLLKNTYTINRDNTIRGNVSFDWLLSLPWITNVDLTAAISYSDKLQRANDLYSSAVSKAVLHGIEEGYFLATPYSGTVLPVQLIPAGYWYNELCLDDRPLSFKVTAKANWARKWGAVSSKLKIGADWSGDRNFGMGQYSEDMATAPTFREYRYSDKPTMHNVAAFIEENFMVPVGKGRINLIAGVRNDNTIISGSAYGTTSSVSPRFNAKYTVIDAKGRNKMILRALAFRGSWGMAVKQPSYAILYPQPTYYDVRSFASTTNSDNVSYEAYHILPRIIEYNPDLKWQKGIQSEVGMEMNLAGNKVSLAAFYNRTLDAYTLVSTYKETFYNFTSISDLAACPIPIDNRTFSVNAATGQVTAFDKTGVLPSQNLSYSRYNIFNAVNKPTNLQNPIDRYGVEWTVDFARINAINTTIRLDGTWYGYKSLNTNMEAYCPTTTMSSGGGTDHFKYVGWYYGGNASSNGSKTQTLKTNVTVTTHIPKVRMILSVKLESCLLKYSRSLSDMADGSQRGYVLEDRGNILSYKEGASIYDGDCYMVYFPEYYTSYGDPTPHPYLEALKAAKGTDPNLFNDLAKLAYSTSYTYTFKEDYISPYFSANMSVTKEIGDIASISFYVNNFFNNRSQVLSSKTGNYMSVGGYIPAFYYGLTLRLKFQ